MAACTVLSLPGWQGSGPDHWQTLWERRFGYQRVDQHDWERPLRGDWITHLEDVVTTPLLSKQEQKNAYPRWHSGDLTQNPQEESIVLVAHSLGCHLVAAWAAVSPSVGRVRAALLVAPPDPLRGDWPAALQSWRKPVLAPLPFPATCVVSRNDPFASPQAGQALAAAWGARCVALEGAGHINAASGLGDWPTGHAMLLDLAGSQI